MEGQKKETQLTQEKQVGIYRKTHQELTEKRTAKDTVQG